MTRIIDPPRDQFKKLPTPLEAGERKVIDLFDRKLPPKWEIYVQPHLNGLRPDIVLLHPGLGVAVFEVLLRLHGDWRSTVHLSRFA